MNKNKEKDSSLCVFRRMSEKLMREAYHTANEKCIDCMNERIAAKLYG